MIVCCVGQWERWNALSLLCLRTKKTPEFVELSAILLWARPGKTRKWNWFLVCLSLYTMICVLGSTALFAFSILTLKTRNSSTPGPLLLQRGRVEMIQRIPHPLIVKILQPFCALLGAWNQQMDWRFFSLMWESYRSKEELQSCSFAIYQLDHTQLWGTILYNFPSHVPN